MKVIIIISVFFPLYAYSVELCEEPKVKAEEALRIVSRYRAETKADERYTLESLKYDYISCSWHVSYTFPIKNDGFPELHSRSYIYIFTSEMDVKEFRF